MARHNLGLGNSVSSSQRRRRVRRNAIVGTNDSLLRSKNQATIGDAAINKTAGKLEEIFEQNKITRAATNKLLKDTLPADKAAFEAAGKGNENRQRATNTQARAVADRLAKEKALEAKRLEEQRFNDEVDADQKKAVAGQKERQEQRRTGKGPGETDKQFQQRVDRNYQERTGIDRSGSKPVAPKGSGPTGLLTAEEQYLADLEKNKLGIKKTPTVTSKIGNLGEQVGKAVNKVTGSPGPASVNQDARLAARRLRTSLAPEVGVDLSKPPLVGRKSLKDPVLEAERVLNRAKLTAGNRIIRNNKIIKQAQQGPDTFRNRELIAKATEDNLRLKNELRVANTKVSSTTLTEPTPPKPEVKPTVRSELKAAGGRLGNALGQSKVGQAFTGLRNKFKPPVPPSAATTAGKTVGETAAKVGEVVGEGAQTVKTATGDFVDGIKTGAGISDSRTVEEGVSAATKKVEDVAPKVKNALGRGTDKAKEVFSGIVNVFKKSPDAANAGKVVDAAERAGILVRGATGVLKLAGGVASLGVGIAAQETLFNAIRLAGEQGPSSDDRAATIRAAASDDSIGDVFRTATAQDEAGGGFGSVSEGSPLIDVGNAYDKLRRGLVAPTAFAADTADQLGAGAVEFGSDVNNFVKGRPTGTIRGLAGERGQRRGGISPVAPGKTRAEIVTEERAAGVVPTEQPTGVRPPERGPSGQGATDNPTVNRTQALPRYDVAGNPVNDPVAAQNNPQLEAAVTAEQARADKVQRLFDSIGGPTRREGLRTSSAQGGAGAASQLDPGTGFIRAPDGNITRFATPPQQQPEQQPEPQNGLRTGSIFKGGTPKTMDQAAAQRIITNGIRQQQGINQGGGPTFSEQTSRFTAIQNGLKQQFDQLIGSSAETRAIVGQFDIDSLQGREDAIGTLSNSNVPGAQSAIGQLVAQNIVQVAKDNRGLLDRIANIFGFGNQFDVSSFLNNIVVDGRDVSLQGDNGALTPVASLDDFGEATRNVIVRVASDKSGR